ncbi:14-3-3 protein [Kipferlia bialata]|uniref:14-3-3 protein n=1 Tax=Kipferlia bialata TaxID=797122 RepID=A0A9K3CRG9_9EUKA|nr:14-3-3 protein [Kipferlia bialata]|eukprot:g2000.t1
MEMIHHTTTIATDRKELSVEERNLLSVAYKNYVAGRRSSWRVLCTLEHGQQVAQNVRRIQMVADMRRKVEGELEETCTNILALLQDVLIPGAVSFEARVFYFKMQADYFRYIAEIVSGERRKMAAEQALLAYKTATEIAETHLSGTHPLLLGLGLNFSVFYFEILSNRDKACKVAKDAFDGAIPGLDDLSEASYRDSTLLMKLLRDNLNRWSSQHDEQ